MRFILSQKLSRENPCKICPPLDKSSLNSLNSFKPSKIILKGE